MKNSNFPRINDRICATTTPVTTFFIVRGVGPGNTILYSAFTNDGTADTQVTDDITWESSDTAIATVNAGGIVTRISNGTAVIRATRADMIAYSAITLSDDVEFCDTRPVGTVIAIDCSRSMVVQVAPEYMTGLDVAKTVANAIIAALNDDKDFIAIETFDGAPIVKCELSQLMEVLTNTVNQLARVTHERGGTDIRHALRRSIDTLAITTEVIVQPAIILISDGVVNPEPGSADENDIQTLAANFKDMGGIIICVGMNSSGKAYLRLRDVATPGYFVNVTNTAGSTAAAISQVLGFAPYYCAGSS